MAQLDTVPCTACPPLPLCWLWQGSNEDAVGMWDKASGIGLDTRVAQSCRGRTILVIKCDCISLEPWGDLAMTPSQSLLLAPHWLQPSRFFLPLQPYFSHVTCGSWSVDSGLLGVDKACGLVQVTATQAHSPRAVGLCRQLLQECGVKACAVYVRSQRTGMGIGAASGGQWCPKLHPSNPCQPCCQREWCRRNTDQDVT